MPRMRANCNVLPAVYAEQLRLKISHGEYDESDALAVIIWLLERARGYK